MDLSLSESTEIRPDTARYAEKTLWGWQAIKDPRSGKRSS